MPLRSTVLKSPFFARTMLLNDLNQVRDGAALSDVNCPESLAIPAHLADPSLPNAQAYSQEV